MVTLFLKLHVMLCSKETMHHKQVPYHGDCSDGEPLPVITVGEPTAGELTVEEPTAYVPDLFQYPKNATRDNGHGFMSDNHAQDIHPPDLPAPPSPTLLLPSSFPNKIRIAVVGDKSQALGSNCSWSHVFQTNLGKVDGYTKNAGLMLIKVDDYTQGFHLLEIFCAAMSIAMSSTVYRMLTPLPFGRGKMVSNLSPPCSHAASLPILISLVHPSLPLSRALEEGYCSHVVHYCLWGVIHKLMGSNNMHKLYCAQALAYHSEHLHLDPAWMWITQESHAISPTR